MSSRKLARFAVVFFAAMALAAVLASAAFAEPNSTVTCNTCHSGAGPVPTVTLVSDTGTTATYSVQQVGSAWAAFDGSTWLSAGATSSGTFSGPTGHAFTVFSVSGFPGPIGSTTVGGGGPTTYTIVPSAGAHGSISPATAQTVASGANVTFTIAADAGYHIADVVVNGASVGAVGSYTFTNVTANGTISATFAGETQKSSVTIALSGLKAGVLKYRKMVTVKGTVTPARVGKATVRFERKVGAKWVLAKSIARTINATSGAYSYTYKPLKTGSFRVSTTVAKTPVYTAAATAWKLFKVK
jgi:hypothetical protein